MACIFIFAFLVSCLILLNKLHHELTELRIQVDEMKICSQSTHSPNITQNGPLESEKSIVLKNNPRPEQAHGGRPVGANGLPLDLIKFKQQMNENRSRTINSNKSPVTGER